MTKTAGIRWVSVADLVDMNEYIIKKTTPNEPIGIRSQGSLESAQCAPAQTRHFGQTEDMYLLGAVLLNRLIKNHPFFNGNKRTAYLAAQTLLRINGYDLYAPHEEILLLCEDLAMIDYDEAKIATWIAQYSTPITDTNR